MHCQARQQQSQCHQRCNDALSSFSSDLLVCQQSYSCSAAALTGYGFRAPNDCWVAAWMVVLQSVWGQLLDAVVLGVIFARISHPKQRARTIFMSDSAVIARRDGVLKFMFRVGDVRATQVGSSCEVMGEQP